MPPRCLTQHIRDICSELQEKHKKTTSETLLTSCRKALKVASSNKQIKTVLNEMKVPTENKGYDLEPLENYDQIQKINLLSKPVFYFLDA